jgi:RNA polymerase sigma factor (sigma-70 family)
VSLHSDVIAASVPGAVLTDEQLRTLAERIRKGEPSAEEEFVRLFSPRIAFLARIRTRDREAARDLTQDVMLAVVLAVRNGQLRAGERLAAFVYGTARNLINNHQRTRARRPREDPIDSSLHLDSPPDPVEDNQRLALVLRALGSLDSIDRRILLLTLGGGLKPGEIAARLGLTSEVVRTRKSRALKKTMEQVKSLLRR